MTTRQISCGFLALMLACGGTSNVLAAKKKVEAEPVDVNLVKGKNVLKCSRSGDNIRGLTVRDFTLKPL